MKIPSVVQEEVSVRNTTNSVCHRSVAARVSARRGTAFTLVELLIVIGVILILMAITIPTIQTIVIQAKTRETRVVMQSAAAMLAELDAHSAISSLPVLATPVWATANGDVSDGDSANDRLSTPVQQTGQALAVMLALPGNQDAFMKLPSAQRSTINVGGNALPMLLDGWGNPIILVPATGMVVSTGGGATTPLIVSSRTVNGADKTNRMYFASAGADGNFYNAGDDNLYSFDR